MNLKFSIRRYELLADLADREGDQRGFWMYTGAANALREIEKENEETKSEHMARSQMDDHPSGKQNTGKENG